MITLPRHLRKETYLYMSAKTKVAIAEDIQNLFSEKTFDFSTNLSGKFISDSEFYITSKYSAFFSDSGSSGHTSLNGKIMTEDGRVVIKLVVNPAPRIYVWAFAPLLFGFFFLYAIISMANETELGPLFITIILMIIIPFAVLVYGQASKDQLRKKFADILKLSKI